MPSTMPAKYYIYAGGRWCEVDTRRGRVVGYRQRGRFCFLRGGKLEIGRTSAVLKALRTLAAGAGDAARDSAPLLGRRPHRSRRQSSRGPHCCSQHLHHSRCDVNANEVEKAPASPRKRKRSVSEEIHKAKLSKSEPLLIEEHCQATPVKKREEVQSLLSSSDAGKEEKKTPIKKKIGGKIRNEEKPSKSLQSSSDEEQQKKQSQKPKTTPKARGKETRNSPDGEKKSQQQKSSQKAKPNVEEMLVQSLLETSSSENNAKVSPKDGPILRSKPSRKRHESSSSSESSDRMELCKELIIDSEDVRVLRRFLARAAGGEELERFDRDKEYKTRVFYRLNPLVLLKRCGPLERLLLQRLTLEEFARHLGLRSVADVTPEKRYRMRHSTRQARNTAGVTSGSEDDKEVTRPKRRQLWNRDKEIFDNARSSRSSELKVKPQIHRPRDSSQDSTDSDTEVKKHTKKLLEKRASARINPNRGEKTKTNAVNTDSIVVASNSGSSDGDTEVKKHTKKLLDRRAGARINPRREEKTKTNAGHNDSIVVASTSGSSTNSDENRRKSHRIREKNDSVIVSDESDSEVVTNRRRSRNDENRGRSRRRTRGMKEDDESAVVSDDGKQGKRKTRARRKSKSGNNDSVVISDESCSNTDKNSDGNELKSTRKTRSQGPEKRVLREHTVVISDDIDESRAKSRTGTKAQEPKVQNSVVVSDESNSNTDDNKTTRTRARGPDIALKKQNRTYSNAKKETYKAKKEVDSTVTKKTTRSSMKGTDDGSLKEINKTDNSRNNQKIKNKEHKAGPLSKTKDTSKDQDKPVISDSDEAIETPKSPKKNIGKDLAKQLWATNTPRNHKGRFLKRKEEEKDISTDRNEKQREIKVNEDRKKEGLKDKNKEKDKVDEKHRMRNETDKQKIKQKERDRVEKDKENSQSSPNKRKEIDKKSAVARSMFIKPVKYKKSSVANGREYTSLEDHAIVAWVSVGNRERKVNGNAVWRDLEGEYPRLTSQKRSWHSLRNRYLRYILPALGALALPPAQVSRLRAAAAQGCMRPRSGSRRNSIFSAPRVRSAAAAGRRRIVSVSASDTDDKSDDDRKERTPPPSRRARAPSPSPRRVPPSAPPSPRRAPPSPRRSRTAAATPTPKKKRIHHL